jgi:predicted Fe-Mo cluster-binding NifX family protein
MFDLGSIKVAIATDNFLNISPHAGRCKAYEIYEITGDIPTGRVSLVNKFIPIYSEVESDEECISNKSCHAKLASAISECKALICRSAGKRLIEDMNKWGIEVVLTDETDALRAALKYAYGELKSEPGFTCTKL